jgi:hypothetical protein
MAMHNGEARPPCCETMLNASIVHIWHRYALAYCDMYKANLKSAARMRARALKLQCRLKSRGCPSCTPPGQRSCGHYKTAECRRITLSASISGAPSRRALPSLTFLMLTCLHTTLLRSLRMAHDHTARVSQVPSTATLSGRRPGCRHSTRSAQR